MNAVLQEHAEASAVDQAGTAARRDAAADRFNEHFGRDDGHRLVHELADGLTMLRNLLFHRIHEDVEAEFGMDSMLSPVSVAKSERIAKFEIEIYQSAEAACEMVHRGYVPGNGDWLAQWLLELRVGTAHTHTAVQQRLAHYLTRDRDERELLFSNVLIADFPEAAKAPLVMFRLYPLAIDLVTAMGFDNTQMVTEFRRRQMRLLPAIADCRRCRGQALSNGESCRECGNPLWNFHWLTAD